MLELNKIYCGDCLKVMKQIDANSIDAIITDPPYGIGFMGKEWDNFKPKYINEKMEKDNKRPATRIARTQRSNATGTYDLSLRGLIGFQKWVGNWAIECFRVLKPGGYLLSFGGTRTYHRMACAIEDVGFEIRDMIEWIYGSGFPKSLNIGKAIDKLQGIEIKSTYMPNYKNNDYGKGFGGGIKDNIPSDNGFNGWGTALKPAHEPICMARKLLSEKTVAENVLKWGTGGINIDECRIETNNNDINIRVNPVKNAPKDNNFLGGIVGPEQNNPHTFETQGRFPANVIHDGSDEAMAEFEKYGNSYSKGGGGFKSPCWSESIPENQKKDYGDYIGYLDSGTPARFFYCAKASKSERESGLHILEANKENLQGLDTRGRTLVREDGTKTLVERWKGVPSVNNHPTVKPIKLMEYLIKLVTVEGATVLDPFCGSGSTLIACSNLSRNYIGIDNEADYIEIANKRLANTYRQLELL